MRSKKKIILPFPIQSLLRIDMQTQIKTVHVIFSDTSWNDIFIYRIGNLYLGQVIGEGRTYKNTYMHTRIAIFISIGTYINTNLAIQLHCEVCLVCQLSLSYNAPYRLCFRRVTIDSTANKFPSRASSL